MGKTNAADPLNAEGFLSISVKVERRLGTSPSMTYLLYEYVCAWTTLLVTYHTMAHLLADTCQLVNLIIVGFIRSITSCIDKSTRPSSPALSAQEGELDNLLTEPSGGWDDLPASRGYNKPQNMTIDSNPNGGTAQIQGSERLPATWIEGRTMEELSREEAELARFDPPGPPRDIEDFGDFEQAPGTGPL